MPINDVIGQVASEFYEAMRAADEHIDYLEIHVAELEKEVQLYQEFVLHCKDKHSIPDVCCPDIPLCNDYMLGKKSTYIQPKTGGRRCKMCARIHTSKYRKEKIAHDPSN